MWRLPCLWCETTQRDFAAPWHSTATVGQGWCGPRCEDDKRDYLITVDLYYSGFSEIDYLGNTKGNDSYREAEASLWRGTVFRTPVCRTVAVNLTQKSCNFSARSSNSHTSHPPQRIHRVMGKPNKLSILLNSYWKKPRKAVRIHSGYSCIPEYTDTGILKPSPVANVSKNEDASPKPQRLLLQLAVPATAMEEMSRNKTRQASYYNQHARDLPELQVGDIVRFIPPGRDRSSSQEQIKATVRARHASRSYVTVMEDGREFRRSRKHLRKTTEQFQFTVAANNVASTVTANSEAPTVTKTRQQPYSGGYSGSIYGDSQRGWIDSDSRRGRIDSDSRRGRIYSGG